jgi:hypothetical protein
MATNNNSILVNQELFYGGKSTDKKIGISNSFADSVALDFRKNPSQMTVLPGAVTNTSGTIKDLILGMTQTPDGFRWGVGDAGSFYQFNNSNVVSFEGSISEASGGGIVYRQDTDFIYMSGQTTVSRKGMIQKKALVDKGLQAGYFAESVSTSPTVAQTLATDVTGAYIGSGTLRSTAALTYTVPTAISESSVDQCIFLPDIEPFYSIPVYVVTKGTGNLTLTLHDTGNNLLGSVTILTANVTAGAYNTFRFTTPIRATVQPNSAQYHFHITSTVADTTVATVTANDLRTANFQLYASRLIQTVNNLHPMAVFQQYVCTGNERYLSVWEPLSDVPDNSEWQRHRLTFPPGYECTSLAVNDEYLLIGCEKRTANGVRNFQEGIIFFWDGAAQTYNFFIEVKMGSPYSMYTYQNITYMYINGALYAWTGGKQLIKVRTFEGTDSEFSSTVDDTFVYPNMITARRDIMLLAYPSYTTLLNLRYGVYSWGAIDKNYPQSFGYSYQLASKTQYYTVSNGLKMGMIQNFVDTLYISWKENGAYGIDVVDNTSPAASVGSWESLIFDAKAVYKEKSALRYRISFDTLPTGVTITPKYKLNRGNWVTGTSVTTGTSAYQEINKRFFEIQFGFDFTTTGTTPTILAATLEARKLDEENDM